MADNTEPTLKLIGVVRSDLKTTQDPPREGSHRQQEATLEIFPAYCMGLAGMDELDKILVLYWLDQADRKVLRVYPGGDRNKEMIGVFRNRSPLRPNPIGISVVEVIEVGIQHVRVRGMDAIDGTPILDIKSPPSHDWSRAASQSEDT